ncbi:MAG: biopolymer transporter ExbD [Microcoleaceae cyanobacterium]
MKIHLDSSTNSDEARIELLPLIDVVFCILTFFILAALQLTRQQAINVDLPKATTGETQMQKMLIVGIDQAGQTYVNQQQITENQLERELKKFLRWNANGLVVVYAPKDSKYNDVVQVLDQIRSVTNRVALATLPSSAETPATQGPNLFDPSRLTPPPTPGIKNPVLQPAPAVPEGSLPPNPLLLPEVAPNQPTSPEPSGSNPLNSQPLGSSPAGTIETPTPSQSPQ